MSIDYDQLREWLEESAPGPWTVKIDEWDEVIVANESGHAMSWGEQVRFQMEAGDRNADPYLVALAPDMARELLRLRGGVEKVREMCLLERDAAFQENPVRAGEVTAFNICAEQLTNLLEGDIK